MRTAPAFSLVLLLTLPVAGCGTSNGPSESVRGEWTARGIGHGLLFGMSLQQSGDRVSGVACGVSDGVVLFRNAPVGGDYPDVWFVVTPESASACCPQMAGLTFSGKLDDTLDIVGRSDFGSDLRFQRGQSGCPQ